VTFARLAVAWLMVAGWFVIATVANIVTMVRATKSQDAVTYIGVLPHYLKRRLLEAAVLTLIASLWFDTLGSGEWWLLFLLFGALVSSSKQFAPAPDNLSRGVLIADIVFDLARYVGAGALLAWRLS